MVPQILLYVEEGAERSGKLNRGTFLARVDERKIVKGLWVSSANQMGDKVVFVTLKPENRQDAYLLVEDVMRGKKLRVKLIVPMEDGRSSDLYFRYDLKGSYAAITRVLKACVEIRKEFDDSRYFEEEDETTIKKYPAVYRY
jgi:hypothetical protein